MIATIGVADASDKKIVCIDLRRKQVVSSVSRSVDTLRKDTG